MDQAKSLRMLQGIGKRRDKGVADHFRLGQLRVTGSPPTLTLPSLGTSPGLARMTPATIVANWAIGHPSAQSAPVNVRLVTGATIGYILVPARRLHSPPLPKSPRLCSRQLPSHLSQVG